MIARPLALDCATSRCGIAVIVSFRARSWGGSFALNRVFGDVSRLHFSDVQKLFKKSSNNLLTLYFPFGIVALHTVTNRNKMRTKTLLLSAAAVAAGLVSSQAQSNVYSANVVGYVSVTANAGQFTLWSNPLDSGSNTLSGLFPSAPNGTLVEVWNGAGFQSATKGFGGVWTTNLTINPGEGFFIKYAASTTNTFVGSIVVPNNASVTNSFVGSLFYLVGSPVPYTDNLSGTNLNLTVGNGSIVEIWNGTGFQSATKGFGGVWTTNLVMTPGQGFFLKPSATNNWVQSLNLQ